MLNYPNSSNVSKSRQETPKHLEARSWIFRNLQKSVWKTLLRWNFLEILVKHTMKWTESGNCWRLLEGSQLCFIYYMLMFHLWGEAIFLPPDCIWLWRSVEDSALLRWESQLPSNVQVFPYTSRWEVWQMENISKIFFWDQKTLRLNQYENVLGRDNPKKQQELTKSWHASQSTQASHFWPRSRQLVWISGSPQSPSRVQQIVQKSST